MNITLRDWTAFMAGLSVGLAGAGIFGAIVYDPARLPGSVVAGMFALVALLLWFASRRHAVVTES